MLFTQNESLDNYVKYTESTLRAAFWWKIAVGSTWSNQGVTCPHLHEGHVGQYWFLGSKFPLNTMKDTMITNTTTIIIYITSMRIPGVFVHVRFSIRIIGNLNIKTFTSITNMVLILKLRMSTLSICTLKLLKTNVFMNTAYSLRAQERFIRSFYFSMAICLVCICWVFCCSFWGDAALSTTIWFGFDGVYAAIRWWYLVTSCTPNL